MPMILQLRCMFKQSLVEATLKSVCDELIKILSCWWQVSVGASRGVVWCYSKAIESLCPVCFSSMFKHPVCVLFVSKSAQLFPLTCPATWFPTWKVNHRKKKKKKVLCTWGLKLLKYPFHLILTLFTSLTIIFWELSCMFYSGFMEMTAQGWTFAK